MHGIESTVGGETAHVAWDHKQILWTQVLAAYNCTACDKRTCPLYVTPCPGNTAIDPCGCCQHCAKQKLQPCGGPDWELGYCDKHLKCFSITGLGLVEIPNVGICKELPGEEYREYFEDDDINCPKQTGCYRVVGTCDCPTKHTCILDSFQYSELYCNPKYDSPDYEHVYEYKCTSHGCDIVDDRCMCTSSGCDKKFPFQDSKECYKALTERLCANVTCPEVEALKCPRDSFASHPHTPLLMCCPTIPSYCTCDFEQCSTTCPKGKRKVTVWKTNGVPGACCDKTVCVL
ncbi:cysteine-rich motor neuron 1 protein-like [Gastrophryne carolinensis]